ncbi:hypothetical protein BD310DRAFT_924370 [Dichomitus squalens]|uniref:Uncharacterized protein n=1 Tax=Dichomitus squalens TaxID=114155 RepID=A0A4Q9PY22_9APHY|nr:hypothetical protein BD310DRAFT_924370 [Dichomitus squalens]
MLPFCRCHSASGNCRSAIGPTLANIGRYQVPVYDFCESIAFCGLRTILIGSTLLLKGA